MKYRYHKPGSRKGYVHMMYDMYGTETARDLALKLCIKHTTIKAWIDRWKSDDKKADYSGRKVT